MVLKQNFKNFKIILILFLYKADVLYIERNDKRLGKKTSKKHNARILIL